MYTHNISWVEYNPYVKAHVAKNFNTTSDMVDTHVNVLKKKKVTNLKVTDIQTGKEV
jgi:hypothetical protein